MFDVLIKNGLVCDGSGRPGRVGDVAITGDSISAIGGSISSEAGHIVDATGKIVSPGFIDVHGHSDYLLLMDPSCDSKTTQGITTDVGGNCGLSPGPYNSDNWYVDWWVDNPKNFFSVARSEGEEILKSHGVDFDWQHLGGFFDSLEKQGIGLNYTGLVGHYVLRAAVFGEIDSQPWRQPSSLELDEMKALLRDSLENGARGLSCAFHHTDPELDVSENEFVELANVVAAYNGVFAFHLRSYTDFLLSSVREAIELARKTGVRTTISHLWGDGKEYWGKVPYAMEMIEDARASGVPIWCDVLLTLPPRNYMSGGIKTLLPDSVFDQADGDWADYFSVSGRVDEVSSMLRQGGPNRWYKERFNPITYWPLWDEMTRVIYADETPEFVGKTLDHVGRIMDTDSFGAICHLLKRNDGRVETSMERTTDRDIASVLSSPTSMIGTDGSPIKPIKSSRPPNPRLYCTFPLLFRHFVRELNVLTLENAIMKCTSLPAEFLGLPDRGELRIGHKADVTVFDADNIQDFQNLMERPRNYTEYSEGVEHVWVNGQEVVSGGRPSNGLPGRLLKHELSR